ncbi:MAG: SRPBCC family protein [Thermomicrobiales bacterium]
MSIGPTGRVVRTDSGYELVIERTYRASAEDVWASIVESERLDRWIGRYDGMTGKGQTVTFWVTAEGEGLSEKISIHECEPPTRLLVESKQGEGSWLMSATLSEADGITTLVFTQALADPATAENTGPGWEYYLDRLGAVLDGTPFKDWDEYYPAQQAHFRQSWQEATGAPANGST